jgi:hypothetical protein
MSHNYPILKKAIAELKKHTGEDGFEGLVCLLLQAWTGIPLVLARSGDQRGRDASSHSLTAPTFGIEAKHYNATKLGTRELIAELCQVCEDKPFLDVWVVATSAIVPDQCTQEVQREGRRRGVDVVIIGADGLGTSSFEVFIAEYPDILAKFLSDGVFSAVMIELNKLKVSVQYPAITERLLHQLTNFGHATMSARSHRYFQKHIATEIEAKAAFGQSLHIRSPSVRFVPRVAASTQLDTWWSRLPRGGNIRFLVGEEGTGKSWLAFRWIAQIIDRGGILPIIIPMTSTTISEPSTIEEMILRHLRRMAPDANVIADYWTAKLRRWITPHHPDLAIRILLIVDGINERRDVHWKQFFRALRSEEWRRSVAALVTCRPAYLDEILPAEPSLRQELITVGEYTDTELEHALAGRFDIAATKTLGPVAGLMRKPRFLDRIQHVPVDEWPSLTVPQLLFDDWMDRVGRKDQRSIPVKQFNRVLAESAQHIWDKKEMTDRDIETLLPQQSRNAVSEIIEGDIFKLNSDVYPSFVLKPSWFALGMAMTICNDLRRADNAEIEAVFERIAAVFEGQDLESNVLFAAYCIADRTGVGTEKARRLLHALLVCRNMSEETESGLSAAACRKIEDFLSQVPHLWTDSHGNLLAQSRIAESLLHARKLGNCDRILSDAALRWCGLIQHEGHPHVHRENDLVYLAEHTSRCQRYGLSVEQETPILGRPHVMTTDVGHLRLHRFALLLISAGDPIDFLPAIASLHVSNALMGENYVNGDAAWILRMGNEALHSQALDLAISMVQASSAHAQLELQHSAFVFLTAIGTNDAISLRSSVASPWPQIEDEPNPCDSPYALHRDQVEKCSACENLDGFRLAFRFSKWASDHELHLAPNACVRITELVQTLENNLWSEGGNVSTSTLYHHVEPLAARLAPRAYGDWVRKSVTSLPSARSRGREGDRFMHRIPLYFMVLDNLSLRSAAACWSDAVMKVGNDEPLHFLTQEANDEMTLFHTVLMCEDAAGRVERFLGRPRGSFDTWDLLMFVGSLNHDALNLTISMLYSEDALAVQRALMLLLNADEIPAPALPRVRELINTSSDGMLFLIHRLALRFPNCGLALDIYNSGISYSNSRAEPYAILGPAVLAVAQIEYVDVRARLSVPARTFFVSESSTTTNADIVSCAEALMRDGGKVGRAPSPDDFALPDVVVVDDAGNNIDIFPQIEFRDRTFRSRSSLSCWGGQQLSRVDRLPNEDEMDEMFRRQPALLKSAWENLPTSWWATPFSVKFLARLSELSPDLVSLWATAALQAQRPEWQRGFSFYVSLCRGLLQADNPLGVKLWEKARAQASRVSLVSKNGSLKWYARAAFESNTSAALHVRAELGSTARTDAALLEIVLAVMNYGRFEWLNGHIENFTASGSTWQQLMGHFLASLAQITSSYQRKCDANTTFEAKVLQAADWVRRRDASARHWYEEFLTLPDCDEAWGALRLFLEVVDIRFWGWKDELDARVGDTEGRLRYLDNLHGRIDAEISRQWEKAVSTFLGIDVGNSQVFPFVDM